MDQRIPFYSISICPRAHSKRSTPRVEDDDTTTAKCDVVSRLPGICILVVAREDRVRDVRARGRWWLVRK